MFTCKQCGTQFLVEGSGPGRYPEFCSEECRRQWKSAHQLHNKELTEEELAKRRERQRRHQQEWRKAHPSPRKSPKTTVCQCCGDSLEGLPGTGAADLKYCSDACRKKAARDRARMSYRRRHGLDVTN